MAMPHSQSTRLSSVTAPNGDPDLLLVRYLTVSESISGLFRMEAEFLSETDDIEFSDMIGKKISIRLSLPSGGDVEERYFHGIVSRFAQGPSSGQLVAYHAEIVPWLWLLTRSSNCRIFQHKNVPDIVKKVFQDLGMTDFKLSLSHSHPEIEYCVQYRETDFNFVSRLLEDAGIGYFFEHAEKQHTLVLFDDASAHSSVPFASSAAYATAQDQERGPGEVDAFARAQVLPTGRYALNDFNFETPSMKLEASENCSISLGDNGRLEFYDYPGRHGTLARGKQRAKLCIETEEMASWEIEGQSYRGDFCPGYTFDLVGHYRGSFDETYLLTSVTHRLTEGVGEEEGASDYANSFTCIPHSVPYRPLRRTPRPVITGTQTATVVGAAGKEIDIDQHGRVIVQFHWDREGKRDQNSSCRVRVSQNWAGKGWGLVAHPRIGQEVLVEFLEGDPDCPIITGRVYNGEQSLSYGTATHTGIKSRSSPGGGASNFNEIMFEDKTGSELFSVQAEKDMTVLVKNDHTENVGNDETLTVEGNRSRTVNKNEDVTVALMRNHMVGINESIEVGAAQEITVGGLRAVTVGLNQDTNIGKNMSLSVGSNLTEQIDKNMSLSVGADLTEQVDKNWSHKTKKNITIEAGDQIVIKTGKAMITMKKNGDITIEGKQINVKASGNIVMKAQKILEN
jgi:type VI secretion system secreted protein VgrG